MREFFLESFDGTNIFVTIWDDVSSPKGVVQIVHGMCEYALCYDTLAKYLNSRGYVVFADDHRAHGRTETDKQRGRHKGNVFKKTLQDELFFYDWLKKEYELPVFYLGHSYGSFLGQAFLQSGTDVKAVALLASGHAKCRFTLGAIALAPIWLVARNWRPRIVNWISDKFVTFKGDSGKNQWNNSVKQRREAYISNPYCHFDVSINFNFYMMSETAKLYSKSAISKLNPTTAVALFSGAEDMVGEKGKGVKRLCKMYTDNGVKCKLHLYENARHCIYDEYNREQVFEDIVNFFEKFIIYRQTSIDEFVNDEN